MGHAHSEIDSSGKLTTAQVQDVTKPRLYTEVAKKLWPMIYSSGYNISLFGFEKLSGFDLAKSRRVHQLLIDRKLLSEDEFVEPFEVTEDELKRVHPQNYLDSLNRGRTVAQITGIGMFRVMPNRLTQKSILRPSRLQTGGTVLAGKLALDRGWAINLGGGFHHCSAQKGSGFCAFADITLHIKYLWDHFPEVKRVMIIDLDVHQGNGYAHDFLGEDNIYILDVYNCTIFPQDEDAKRAIRCKVELQGGTKDAEYLALVRKHVKEAMDEFNPQYVLYNAGTDILEGDVVGHLNITPEGVIERDKIVFTEARSRNIPITMLTSGGFHRSAARVIADSISNLHSLGLIYGPAN